MYTIRAARNAGALTLKPMAAADAVAKALELRGKGYRSITLTKDGSRAAVGLEQFMLDNPVE
jgi:hypothetical protein